VATACADLPDGTVLDGEIIALDENGQPSFNALRNRRFHTKGIQFYAFDLLTYEGRSLLRLPLEQRRKWLAIALERATNPVELPETLERPDALVRGAQQAGLEGIVAKRCHSRYEPAKRRGKG